MTERTAINQLLEAINELPLDILDVVEDIPSAVLAKQRLDNVKVEILSRGYWFNTSKNFPFTPDISKIISVNDNVLSIDVPNNNAVIIKDHKLYDNLNFSFEFDDVQLADVVLDIDFDDIPQTFANWIVKKASRALYTSVIGAGDTQTIQDLRLEEREAMIEAKKEDARNADYNLLNSAKVQALLR